MCNTAIWNYIVYTYRPTIDPPRIMLSGGIMGRKIAPRHKRWHYHTHVPCNL